MNAFFVYVERCGIEFDTAINVLTGGQLGQTVSYRVAVAQEDGKRWGCVFCQFLNWAVQRNHCALQFTDQPSTPLTFIRAGVAFGVGIAATASMGTETVHLVHAMLGSIL